MTEYFYYFLIKKIGFIPILNFIDFDKNKAISILEKLDTSHIDINIMNQ